MMVRSMSAISSTDGVFCNLSASLTRMSLAKSVEDWLKPAKGRGAIFRFAASWGVVSSLSVWP